MKILTTVKRVPDPYGRVRLTSNGVLDDSDVKWVINPFDEIALEEAVRIRERGIDAEIVAVTVGPAVYQEQLRTALAMGADRAVHVDDQEITDGARIAFLLAEVCKQEQPDIVLMGKQAIDDDNAEVAQRLAAILSWPQATCASRIDILSDLRACIHREVDAGREILTIPLPAVITADLRLNEPRYVSLPAIIRARNKPIQSFKSTDFHGCPQTRVRVVRLEDPPARKAGRIVSSVEELISELKEGAV